MDICHVVWFALFLLFNAAEGKHVLRNDETGPKLRYTASWAVEITEGGEKMAEQVARRHGFINAGKVRIHLTCKCYLHTLFMLQCVYEHNGIFIPLPHI